ncbi:hypothetical protein [Emticicia sp. SJ17W-69]|uniref:hypothetical protein n=1 Tax=Emticicia sp. SJ17W-69 TaxID=3421657 RepID=UPI003EBCAFBC
MKTSTKTTLNSIEEVLNEINALVAQKEKEEYARIFLKKSNLSTTYDSNQYLEIMEVSTTLNSRPNVWRANFNL